MTDDKNMSVIHLTETGYNAGRRLCLTDRHDGERNVHAMYSPLHDPKFRAQACPHCLKVWALEAYDSGDDMPDYIRELRGEVAA